MQPKAPEKELTGSAARMTAAHWEAPEIELAAEASESEKKIAELFVIASQKMYIGGPRIEGDTVSCTESLECMVAALKVANDGKKRGVFPNFHILRQWAGCRGEVVARQERGTVIVRMVKDGTRLRLPIEMIGKNPDRCEWLRKLDGEENRVLNTKHVKTREKVEARAAAAAREAELRGQNFDGRPGVRRLLPLPAAPVPAGHTPRHPAAVAPRACQLEARTLLTPWPIPGHSIALQTEHV